MTNIEDYLFVEIKNYENYLINKKGDIYSKNLKKNLKERIDSHTGYKVVTLYSGGYSKTFKVHRLVAQAFLTNPEGKKQVDHINRNKLDNNLSNLRYVTNQQNQYNIGFKKNNKLKEKNICKKKTRKGLRFQ